MMMGMMMREYWYGSFMGRWYEGYRREIAEHFDVWVWSGSTSHRCRGRRGAKQRSIIWIERYLHRVEVWRG